MKNNFLFLLLFFLAACRKDNLTTNPDATISLSADTLKFDTVFTTTGSITQVLKIFNTNTERLRIQSIKLQGGSASPFKINGNGTPSPLIENLELAGGDSAYVFVSVSVPASTSALPFVVQDSISIFYNGNTKQVQLQAYGQNAHFVKRHQITGNEQWTADRPYVLLDTLTIAEGAHLTIKDGCRIYAHAGAQIVVAGQLTVTGKPWDSTRVVFTGDRLDAPYRDQPGTWPGIRFTATSHDNSIQYGVLKNATQAIVLEPSTVLNKLQLSEVIIDNASDAGMLAEGTTFTAQNLLISNCGRNLVLQNGGTYVMEHATLASYATSFAAHRQPVLFISNSANKAINAVFRNCIFWGEPGGVVRDEVVLQKNEAAGFDVQFDGVLWPLTDVPEGATVSTMPLVADPAFVAVNADENGFNFHLAETSPARNSGMTSNVLHDLDGKPRPVGEPDLGAYEEQ